MKGIVRKEYIKKLNELKDLDLIKVLTGVRRCGKSTILLQYIDELKSNGIKDDQIYYNNFEKIQNEEMYDYKYLHNEILKNKIKGKKYYVFLDEIQEVKNFEKMIDSLYLDKEIDIYITGSNAKLLSSELSTLLTGRYIEINIYPFSFKEYVEITNKDINEAFNQYILDGGMPYSTQIEKDDIKYEYLETLYNTILFKDIVKRRNIKDANILEDLSKFLCDSVGSIVSSKSISDYMTSKGRRVSSITVDNYISYFTESLLFYKCKRYDIKGKQNLETLDKIYLVDHGFKTFLSNKSINYGHTLENIIYIEMLRRNYKVKIGKINNLEIDFICEKNNERIYIQVTTSVMDENTFERETRPLKAIKDNYEKIIITLDELPMQEDGIKVINAKKFLMEQY